MNRIINLFLQIATTVAFGMWIKSVEAGIFCLCLNFLIEGWIIYLKGD